MGVGLLGAAWVMRTKFNGCPLRQGLSPSCMCLLRVDPLALYPSVPWSPWELCPEVVFSDNRTLRGALLRAWSRCWRPSAIAAWQWVA